MLFGVSSMVSMWCAGPLPNIWKRPRTRLNSVAAAGGGSESSTESSTISRAQTVVVALMLVEGAGEAIAGFEGIAGLGVHGVAESVVAQ